MGIVIIGDTRDEDIVGAGRSCPVPPYDVKTDVRRHPEEQARRIFSREGIPILNKLHKYLLHRVERSILVFENGAAAAQHHGAVFRVAFLYVDSFGFHCMTLRTPTSRDQYKNIAFYEHRSCEKTSPNGRIFFKS